MQVSVFVCFTCMCMYIFVGVCVSLLGTSATASENTNYRKSVCPHTQLTTKVCKKEEKKNQVCLLCVIDIFIDH